VTRGSDQPQLIGFLAHHVLARRGGRRWTLVRRPAGMRNGPPTRVVFDSRRRAGRPFGASRGGLLAEKCVGGVEVRLEGRGWMYFMNEGQVSERTLPDKACTTAMTTTGGSVTRVWLESRSRRRRRRGLRRWRRSALKLPWSALFQSPRRGSAHPRARHPGRRRGSLGDDGWNGACRDVARHAGARR